MRANAQAVAGVMGGQHERGDRRHARHLPRGRVLRSRAHASHAPQRCSSRRMPAIATSVASTSGTSRRTRARSAAAHRGCGRNVSRMRHVDLYPAAAAADSRSRSTARASHGSSATSAEPDIAKLLAPVGFTVSAFANGRASVTVPAWRPDVTQSVDLFEEVARLRGYDSFSNELRPFRRGTVPDSPLATAHAARARGVRVGGAARGALDAVRARRARRRTCASRIRSPRTRRYLRRELLETLARRAEHNLAQRHRDVRAVRDRQRVRADSRADCRARRCAWRRSCMGHRHPPHWTEPSTPGLRRMGCERARELIAGRSWGAAHRELRIAG